MLRAYFVFKKALHRIQAKNAQLVRLLSTRCPDIAGVEQQAGEDAAETAEALRCALQSLSTRCLRVQLHRHELLLSASESAQFVYLVQSGSLLVQRRSAAALQQQREEAEEKAQDEEGDAARRSLRPFSVVSAGEDVGLCDLLRVLSAGLQSQQRRERRRRARQRAAEAEWEKLKAAALLRKERCFLLSGKSRQREERLSRQARTEAGDAAQDEAEDSRARDGEELRRLLNAASARLLSGCSVAARESAVVFALPRLAVVDWLLAAGPAAVLRLLQQLQPAEDWRQRRWEQEERSRAEAALRLREEGAGAAVRLQRAAGGARLALHRFPSWQSRHLLERERERGRREAWRVQEERRRKLEEAVLALHASSAAHLADIGEAAGGGRTRRSREEDAAVFSRTRQEASRLSEAIKRRHLLGMFSTGEQPLQQTQQQQPAAPLLSSLSLPPLRLELLPPPSPLSSSDSFPCADSSAAVSCLSSPVQSLPSSELDSVASSLAASPAASPWRLQEQQGEDETTALFVFPKTPRDQSGPQLPLLLPLPAIPTPPLWLSCAAPAAAASLPPALHLVTLPSSSSSSCFVLPAARRSLALPPPQLQSLLTSLTARQLQLQPQARTTAAARTRPPAPSAAAASLPPSSRPSPPAARLGQRDMAMQRLRERVVSVWREADEAERERRRRRLQAVVSSLTSRLRRRMEAERAAAAAQAAAQERDAAAAGRLRDGSASSGSASPPANESDSFNFVNCWAGDGSSGLKWRFLTQQEADRE